MSLLWERGGAPGRGGATERTQKHGWTFCDVTHTQHRQHETRPCFSLFWQQAAHVDGGQWRQERTRTAAGALDWVSCEWHTVVFILSAVVGIFSDNFTAKGGTLVFYFFTSLSFNIPVSPKNSWYNIQNILIFLFTYSRPCLCISQNLLIYKP